MKGKCKGKGHKGMKSGKSKTKGGKGKKKGRMGY